MEKESIELLDYKKEKTEERLKSNQKRNKIEFFIVLGLTLIIILILILMIIKKI